MIFSTSVQSILLNEIERRSLPADFISTVERWYLPVAERLFHQQKKLGMTFMVSFNGAQGSGKSTMTAFLRLILLHHFKLNAIEVSIDDFYLTSFQFYEGGFNILFLSTG